MCKVKYLRGNDRGGCYANIRNNFTHWVDKDDLKDEDDLKNDDDLKNEDDNKNEEKHLKNKEDL